MFSRRRGGTSEGWSAGKAAGNSNQIKRAKRADAATAAREHPEGEPPGDFCDKLCVRGSWPRARHRRTAAHHKKVSNDRSMPEGTREGRRGLRSGQIPPPSPALARRQADEEAQRERAARQAVEAADEKDQTIAALQAEVDQMKQLQKQAEAEVAQLKQTIAEMATIEEQLRDFIRENVPDVSRENASVADDVCRENRSWSVNS